MITPRHPRVFLGATNRRPKNTPTATIPIIHPINLLPYGYWPKFSGKPMPSEFTNPICGLKNPFLYFQEMGFKIPTPYLPSGQGDWRANLCWDDSEMGR